MNTVREVTTNEILVKAKLFGTETEIQVDTGATISVMSADLVPPGIPVYFHRNDKIRLNAYGGVPIQDIGFLRVTVELGSKRIHWPCLITKSNTKRMLLGNDFIEYFKVNINPVTHTISSTIFGVVPYSRKPTDIVKLIGLPPIVDDVTSMRQGSIKTVKFHNSSSMRRPWPKQPTVQKGNPFGNSEGKRSN